MKTFEFSVIASGLDPGAEDFADRFFDAGCDDATLSFQKGHIILDFARQADSLAAAIVSAVNSVKAAGAEVDRVEPDPLVNLSEIASRTGLTRAAVTHYSQGKRGKDFPTPVARVTSDSPLWEWSNVAKWLFKNAKISRDAAIEAEVVRAANAAIASHSNRLSDDIEGSLKAYEESLEKEAA